MKSLFRFRLPVFLLMLPWMILTAAEPMKVYFVGNSFTMNASPKRIQNMMAELGVKMNWAAHLSGGKSLIRHAKYAGEPEIKWMTPSNFDGRDSRAGEFGHYDNALKENKWDALVLQLFGSNLHDDMEAVSIFIDLCVENQSCENVYLYSTWPGRPRPRGRETDFASLDFDFSAEWEGEYTASAEDTSRDAGKNYASADYVDTLLAELRKKYPEVNIRLIPVGEVLYRADRAIKSGRLPEVLDLAKRNPDGVPGYREGDTEAKGVSMFYNDPLHLRKGLGVLISSNTLAAVLSEKSPVGLSGKHVELNGGENEAVLKKMQELIWETVTGMPETGIK